LMSASNRFLISRGVLYRMRKGHHVVCQIGHWQTLGRCCRRSILALYFSLLVSQHLIDGGIRNHLVHPESQCYRKCLAFSFDKEAWVHGLGACSN
jgi:hypothetical protein